MHIHLASQEKGDQMGSIEAAQSHSTRVRTTTLSSPGLWAQGGLRYLYMLRCHLDGHKGRLVSEDGYGASLLYEGSSMVELCQNARAHPLLLGILTKPSLPSALIVVPLPPSPLLFTFCPSLWCPVVVTPVTQCLFLLFSVCSYDLLVMGWEATDRGGLGFLGPKLRRLG